MVKTSVKTRALNELKRFVNKFGLDALDNTALKIKHLSIQTQVYLTK